MCHEITICVTSLETNLFYWLDISEIDTAKELKQLIYSKVGEGKEFEITETENIPNFGYSYQKYVDYIDLLENHDPELVFEYFNLNRFSAVSDFEDRYRGSYDSWESYLREVYFDLFDRLEKDTAFYGVGIDQFLDIDAMINACKNNGIEAVRIEDALHFFEC